MTTKLIGDVAQYYSSRLAEHGCTAKGVDWNGEESQTIRFEQLTKIVGHDTGFSVNDFGCGYGAYLDYLDKKFDSYSYIGIDVSSDMVESAKEMHGSKLHANFMVGTEPGKPADYSVASGIFNVKLGYSADEWYAYIKNVLDLMDYVSEKGFSFNCLTSYSDAHMMKDNLYYANPCEIFDLCMKKYSRNVAVLHDYGLYEFTVLVRKL